MKGFLIIGSSKSVLDYLSTDNLEQEVKRKKILFKRNVLKDKSFDNIISYQFFKNSEYIKDNSIDSQVLIGGDIYGDLKSENTKSLNYKEAVKLIQNSCFNEEYIAFEGNSCIGQITDNKIIFQNDLEGSKKLFYYRTKDVFCISTNLSFVLVAIKKNWTLRKNAVISYLCRRESKWPLTFIDNVFVLPPLSRMEITKNNINITSKTLSDFYSLQNISKEEVRQDLYKQYELIIKRKNSNNTAVTLSGGYDTNCLIKLFTQVYGKSFTAVSVGYEAKKERGTNINDETIYADSVAKKLGVSLKKYIFSANDFFNELDSFIDAIDQPGHDPSSNFIMQKSLKSDGFNLVINGNGGDPNYSSYNYLTCAISMHNFSQNIKFDFPKMVGRFLNYRGPFTYFRPRFLKENINNESFHSLYERLHLLKSPICKNINSKRLLEIDSEKYFREKYFNNLFKEFKTTHELLYSLFLVENPEMYHVLTMAERNNIDILTPFSNIKAALTVINGSNYNKINTRKFETSIFGGIDEELLAKSKSGFSIPYAEWMPRVADSVFDFYKDLKYFSKDDFDLQLFRYNYKNNEHFGASNHANVVIWKLLVVKEFIKKHSLNL